MNVENVEKLEFYSIHAVEKTMFIILSSNSCYKFYLTSSGVISARNLITGC